jgi:hypothetical protein
MTAQIADTINDALSPEGVGVIIKAAHLCMTTRGIHSRGTELITSRIRRIRHLRGNRNSIPLLEGMSTEQIANLRINGSSRQSKKASKAVTAESFVPTLCGAEFVVFALFGKCARRQETREHLTGSKKVQ